MKCEMFAVLNGKKIKVIRETKDKDYDYLHLEDGDIAIGSPSDVWSESGRIVDEVSASWNYRYEDNHV